MKHIQQHVARKGTMNRDSRPNQASLLLGSTGCSGQYLQKRKPVSQPAGNSQHWHCTSDIQTEPAKAMAPFPPPPPSLAMRIGACCCLYRTTSHSVGHWTGPGPLPWTFLDTCHCKMACYTPPDHTVKLLVGKQLNCIIGPMLSGSLRCRKGSSVTSSTSYWRLLQVWPCHW